MEKAKTASEELIAYILSLTSEQADKILKHPEFVAVMEEYRRKKEVSA